MANERIGVTLAFSADTKSAQRQLKDLNQTITHLLANSNSNSFGITAEIKEATAAAAQLKANLDLATRIDTGKLDLIKFQRSLKESNMSLRDYRIQFSKLGTEGEDAFLKITQAIMNAEVPVRRVGRILSSFAVTLKNTVKWQISSSILQGFTNSIASAYGYAQDLNESLNNIRIVTGYNAEEMKNFAKEANKAAKSLSTTTNEYAKASLIYYQQGLNDSEVAERTNVTIKMANVARESTETVSDQMTAIWNNFYDGSKSVEYYADVMTALGAATASSTAEISQGLEKFASVAETVGLSYEYATAALATVTATTRQSADVVGTAFKTLFARIQDLELGKTLDDGTTLGQYAEALDSVGINIKNSMNEVKDMNIILDEMGAKWHTLSKDQKIALAQNVAGVRQYSQLMALMENWDFFQENLETANNATGALSEQAKIYEESWKAASNRVRASLENLYTKLINDDFFIGLLNSLEKVLDFIGKITDALGGLKGVVTLVGSLILKYFQKEVSIGLKNMSDSLVTFTKRGREKAKQTKDEVYEETKHLLSDDGNRLSVAEKTAYETQLNMQKKLIENEGQISEERRRQYQYLIDINKLKGQELIQNATKIEQKEADVSALTVENREKFYQTRKNDVSKQEFNQLYNQAILEVKTGLQQEAEALSKARNTLLNFAFKSNNDKDQSKELENLFSDKDINKYIKSLGLVIDKTKSTTENFENLKQVLIDSNIETNIISEANERYSQTLGVSSDSTIDFVAKIFDLNKASEEHEQNLKRVQEQTDFYAKSIDKAKIKQTGWTDVITDSTIGVMSLVGAFSSLENVVGTIFDDSMDFGEKLGSITTSMVSSIPMMINGFSHIQNGWSNLNTMLTKMTPTSSLASGLSKITPMLGRAGIAIAAITTVYKIGKQAVEAYNKQLDENAKKIEESAKKSKEVVDANKELVNSYKNLLKEYKVTGKNKEELINQATELGKAYNIENAAILALSGNYKELSKNIDKARKAELEKNIAQQKSALISRTASLQAKIREGAGHASGGGIIGEFNNGVWGRQWGFGEDEYAIGRALASYNFQHLRAYGGDVQFGVYDRYNPYELANMYAEMEFLAQEARKQGSVSSSEIYSDLMEEINADADQYEALKITIAAIREMEQESLAYTIAEQQELDLTQISTFTEYSKFMEEFRKQYSSYLETQGIFAGHFQYKDLISEAEKNILGLSEGLNSLNTQQQAFDELSKKNSEIEKIKKYYEALNNDEQEFFWTIHIDSETTLEEVAKCIEDAQDYLDNNKLFLQVQSLNEALELINKGDYKTLQSNYVGQGKLFANEQKFIEFMQLSLDDQRAFLERETETKFSSAYFGQSENAANFFYKAQEYENELPILDKQAQKARLEAENHPFLQTIVGYLQPKANEYGKAEFTELFEKENYNYVNIFTNILSRLNKDQNNQLYTGIEAFKQFINPGESVDDRDALYDFVGSVLKKQYKETPTQLTIEAFLRQLVANQNNPEFLQNLFSMALGTIFYKTQSGQSSYEFDLENYTKISDQATSAEENYKAAQTGLEQATQSGLEALQNARALELEREKYLSDAGISAEAWQEFSEVLSKNTNLVENFGHDTDLLRVVSDNLAASLLVQSKNLSNLSAKWFEYIQVLSEGNNNSEEYLSTIANIRTALEGVFSIDLSALSGDWITNNIAIIQKVMQGSIEGYKDLQQELILNTVGKDLGTYIVKDMDSGFLNLNQYSQGDKIGSSLIDNYFSAMGLSETEIKRLLSILDISYQVDSKGKIDSNSLIYKGNPILPSGEELNQQLEDLEKIGEKYRYINFLLEKNNKIKNLADTQTLGKVLLEESNLIQQKIQENTDYIAEAEQDVRNYLNTIGYATQDIYFSTTEEALAYFSNMEEDLKKKMNEAIAAGDIESAISWSDKLSGLYEVVNEYRDEVELGLDLAIENLNNSLEQFQNAINTTIEKTTYNLERLDRQIVLLEKDYYKAAEVLSLLFDGDTEINTNDKISQIMANAEIYSQALTDIQALRDKGIISPAAYEEMNKQIWSDYDGSIDDLLELDATMRSYYEDTVAKATEQIGKYTDQLEHNNDVLEYYINLNSLMGKKNNYTWIGKVLEGQAHIAKNNLEISKKQLENYENDVAFWQEQYNSLGPEASEQQKQYVQDQLNAVIALRNEAQNKMLADTQIFLEKEKSIVENQLAELSQKLEESLVGQEYNGSFDQLSIAMQRARSTQEEFLTTTNKIYETTKLMRNAEQEIEKTSNSIAKQRLGDFVRSTKELQSKNKLSHTELEIQQAKYNLLLAEIALEEAQNAKTEVRLRKDAEGNFGYVYTADTIQVANAQQKYDDAENALYNLQLEKANEYAEKSIQIRQELYNTLVELQQKYMSGDFKSYEDYQKAIENATLYYYTKLEDYSDIHSIAMADDGRILQDAWSSSFSSFTNDVSTWKQEVDSYIVDSDKLLTGWNDKVDQVAKDNKLDDIASQVGDIEEAADKAKNALTGKDGLLKALQEELDKVNLILQNYQAQVDINQKVLDTYAKQTDSLKPLNKELDTYNKYLQSILEKEGYVFDENGKIISVPSKPESKPEDSEPESEVKSNDIPSQIDQESEIIQPNYNQQDYGRARFIVIPGTPIYSDIPNDAKLLSKYMVKSYGSVGQEYDIQLKNLKMKLLSSGAVQNKFIYVQGLGWIPYSGIEFTNNSLSSFDTGGYTGTWGPEGKWAMLHQKEIVLNAQDTENLLSAVSILRDIVSTIDMQSSYAQLSRILFNPSVTSSIDTGKSIEQNVKIEANFPHVTDHNEIEEAVNNLINYTSQFVNRK